MFLVTGLLNLFRRRSDPEPEQDYYGTGTVIGNYEYGFDKNGKSVRRRLEDSRYSSQYTPNVGYPKSEWEGSRFADDEDDEPSQDLGHVLYADVKSATGGGSSF